MSLHMVFQIVALIWPNITIDTVRFEVSASDEHYKEYIDVEHDNESSEDPSLLTPSMRNVGNKMTILWKVSQHQPMKSMEIPLT